MSEVLTHSQGLVRRGNRFSELLTTAVNTWDRGMLAVGTLRWVPSNRVQRVIFTECELQGLPSQTMP